MKSRLYPIAIPLIFALTACASDYTKSEAPNNLRVDGADTGSTFHSSRDRRASPPVRLPGSTVWSRQASSVRRTV